MPTVLQVGQTLPHILDHLHDRALATLVTSLARASAEIAALCRQGLVQKTDTTNAFGDEQLVLDVAADKAIMKCLTDSQVVRIASSEETPQEVALDADGKFVVAYDPLDGSSIIPCNWAVGTIAGIWESDRLVGASGKEMVASVVTVYGPRTTLYIAIRNQAWGDAKVVEMTLLENGSWTVSNVVAVMGEKRLFAPANLRSAAENEEYARLITWYMQQRYTLRYTGGMVPDVTQLLIKGGGIFMSPVSENAPAKLRLAYEAMPMAFLIEMAGGRSSDGNVSLLSRSISSCDQRTAVCMGSVGEVSRFESMYNKAHS